MSAELIKQKRELRKLNRKVGKDAFRKFIEVVQAFQDLDLDKPQNYEEGFKQVWPVVKPTLEFAKALKLTGEKFDTAVNEVLVLGGNMYNSSDTEATHTEFTMKLKAIWEKIEIVLEVIKILLTDDNTDKTIDKVIEIGEWLFEN